MLIIDYMHEPFYGSSQSYWIHEYKPEKGSRGCFKILSASIVIEDRRYFIDAMPLNVFTHAAKAVERILDKVEALGLKVEAVLLYRGFASEAVIKLLEAKKLRYLILCPKWPNVSKAIRSLRSECARMEFKVGNTKTTLVLRYDEKGVLVELPHKHELLPFRKICT